MQIVRDLAGYSLGRSDMVRRAMSKKKHSVMEQERKNFIYGIVDEDGNVEVPATGKTIALTRRSWQSNVSAFQYAV